ncbi:MAG: hypothetical protein ACJ8M1_15600 [Chthoniobacterales bacterium]
MNKFRSLIVVGLLCCCTIIASANTIITDPGPGGTNLPNSPNTLGYDFTVGSSAIELTALGMWDQNQDGFTNPHSIGLWDTSGTLIAKAFLVPSTVDPLDGQFRYAPIIPIGSGPVILSAGTTYVLGASYIALDADLFIINTGGNQATFDPAVSPGNARFTSSPIGFAFPDVHNTAGSVVGPNAQFTLVSNGVPESGATVLLLGLTVVCLGCARSRSKASHNGAGLR